MSCARRRRAARQFYGITYEKIDAMNGIFWRADRYSGTPRYLWIRFPTPNGRRDSRWCATSLRLKSLICIARSI